MPRKPRIEFNGAFYHIFSRGNNRKVIFRGKKDFLKFLNLLNISARRFHFVLYAYQLMPNHFHLLIETKDKPLSAIMQSILTRYAKYFNVKYNLSGHLFQDRYKAILCQRESYILELIKYIHLNCVRAGLVKSPEMWLWSSHRIYLGLEKNPLVSEKEILELFSVEMNTARKSYAKFVCENVTQQLNKKLNPGEKYPVAGNEAFLKKIGEIKELRRGIKTKFRIKPENLVEAVSSFTGISKDRICGPRETRECAFGRDIFSYIALNYCGQNTTSIAAFLNRSAAAVTLGIQRTEIRLKQNEKYESAVSSIFEKLKDKKF